MTKYDDAMKENELLRGQLQEGSDPDNPVVTTPLQEEIKRLEEECNALKKELLAAKSGSVPSGEGDVSVEMPRKASSGEIGHFQENNTKLEEALEIARAQCMHSEEALSELNAENAKLKKDMEEMQSANTAYKDQLEDSKSTLAELHSDVERLNTELSEQKAESVKTNAEMESKMAHFKSEKAHLLTENAHLRELAQNPSRYEEAKADIEKLEEKIAKLESSLEKEKQKTTQFMEKSVELQQQLQKATDQSQLEAVREKVKDLKREREELRTENEKLSRKLQGQERTLDIIQGHLVDFDALKEKVEKYKEERNTFRRERDALAEEIDQFKKRNEEKIMQSTPLQCESEKSDDMSTSTVDSTKEDNFGEGGESSSGKKGNVVLPDHKEKKTSGKTHPSTSEGPRNTSASLVHVRPELVTLPTEKGDAPFVMVQKGQSEILNKRVLVKRNDSYVWGYLRYLPKHDDEEDFAGIELLKPSECTGYTMYCVYLDSTVRFL